MLTKLLTKLLQLLFYTYISTKNNEMDSKSALEKLKKYWLAHSGEDYLTKLMELRTELPKNHQSIKALETEIDVLSDVHPKFVKWTQTKAAKTKLNKNNTNA